MIYLVGVSSRALLYYNKLYPQERLNFLVSYAYRSTDTARLLFDHRDMIGSIICDSGTFSLSGNPERLSKKVTFQGYRSYLQQLGKYYDFYFNFDEDFSRDGFSTNEQNQLELEMAGLSPVPVVHNSYGREIPYYIEKGYKMVAIGSGELQDGNVIELNRIVNKMYSEGIKVHLLRCTEYSTLAYTPVYPAIRLPGYGKAHADMSITGTRRNLITINRTRYASFTKNSKNIWASTSTTIRNSSRSTGILKVS